MKTKVCTKCKKEKSLFEFHKLSNSKDGYKNICKTCRSQKSIKTIKAEILLKQNLKTCSCCKEIKKLNEFGLDRNRKNSHKVYCKKCRNDLYDLNKDIINEKRNRRRKQLPWLYTLQTIKQRCNNSNHPKYHRYGGRGIECRITADELKELWFRDKAWLLNQHSIDRIDNDGHYEYSNCQFIELIDNLYKRHKDNENK